MASTDPATLVPERAAATAPLTSNPGAHAAAERDADRVLNSEATPGAGKPSADTDCGGKSDFIAAARRAVQAAGEQSVEKDRASAPPKIVSTSASPAGRIGKLSALIGVTTGVLAALGGLQIRTDPAQFRR